MRHIATIGYMTTQRHERVPALTLGWRLKMALGGGDVSRKDMAVELEVDESTISRWCADRGTPPKRVYLKQWALMTGVDFDWLESGHAGDDTPNPPDDGQRSDRLGQLTEAKRARSRSTGRHGDTARELVAA